MHLPTKYTTPALHKLTCFRIKLFLPIVTSEVVGFDPGVDVIIIIFCDICQFLAIKLAFFLKNQCYDQ
jgi:hypothetical protein